MEDLYIPYSACLFCKHYISEHKCKAFDVIPYEVWNSEHTKPYPGDKGIRFEKISKEEPKDKLGI